MAKDIAKKPSEQPVFNWAPSAPTKVVYIDGKQYTVVSV